MYSFLHAPVAFGDVCGHGDGSTPELRGQSVLLDSRELRGDLVNLDDEFHG